MEIQVKEQMNAKVEEVKGQVNTKVEEGKAKVKVTAVKQWRGDDVACNRVARIPPKLYGIFGQ